MADTYRAEFGAIHHKDYPGLLFTVNPDQFADDVASGLNLVVAIGTRPLTLAATDVLHERARQIGEEKRTPEHDDSNNSSEMAVAAACYALVSTGRWCTVSLQSLWPKTWGLRWFKPGGRRRALVKAGALILAEIERLDRISSSAEEREG